MKSRDEQVATIPVTVREIMSRPTFALGVADARAGRAYHPDYDLWCTNGQWDYERGRTWGTTAPKDLPLKVDGSLNPQAVRFFPEEII